MKKFIQKKYTCQECGKRGVEIHPHHFKSFAKFEKLRFEITNGITLCKKCHYNKHSKEKKND